MDVETRQVIKKTGNKNGGVKESAECRFFLMNWKIQNQLNPEYLAPVDLAEPAEVTNILPILFFLYIKIDDLENMYESDWVWFENYSDEE